MHPDERRGTATLQDLLAIPAEERFHELLSGEIVRKADPTGEHGGETVRPEPFEAQELEVGTLFGDDPTL